jgi:hypothetical protein
MNTVRQMFCTITLFNLVAPTCPVWWVSLFQETGVVHRITYSFSYFFLFVVLFTHFIFDIQKKSCCYPVKQLNNILLK